MTRKKSVKGRKPIAKGERNALLVAVRFDNRDEWRAARWLFKCDCGNDYVARPDLVRRGTILSCGCYREEMASKRMSTIAATHGHSSGGKLSGEYNSWRNMRDRCKYPSSENWERYGGRGIKVCERWDTSFQNFLEDMGLKQKGYTIDRINVDGHYEPGNCRWAPAKTQMRNTSSNRTLTYRGRMMTLAEAVELSGLPRSRVNARLRAGWAVERVFFEGDGRKS